MYSRLATCERTSRSFDIAAAYDAKKPFAKEPVHQRKISSLLERFQGNSNEIKSQLHHLHDNSTLVSVKSISDSIVVRRPTARGSISIWEERTVPASALQVPRTATMSGVAPCLFVIPRTVRCGGPCRHNFSIASTYSP